MKIANTTDRFVLTYTRFLPPPLLMTISQYNCFVVDVTITIVSPTHVITYLWSLFKAQIY